MLSFSQSFPGSEESHYVHLRTKHCCNSDSATCPTPATETPKAKPHIRTLDELFQPHSTAAYHPTPVFQADLHSPASGTAETSRKSCQSKQQNAHLPQRGVGGSGLSWCWGKWGQPAYVCLLVYLPLYMASVGWKGPSESPTVGWITHPCVMSCKSGRLEWLTNSTEGSRGSCHSASSQHLIMISLLRPLPAPSPPPPVLLSNLHVWNVRWVA